MLRKFAKRAQTTAEYAILIALVIAAVTAMQIYVRRGIQASVKKGVDDMGVSMNLSANTQYEPYYLTSSANTTQKSTDSEVMATGGGITRSSNATTNAVRSQNIGWTGY